MHQGDGTAHIFAGDPRTFTLSLHGARNYPFQRMPSDLDVDIASGTGDERYLCALGEALDFALSKDGLRRRDELVLDRLRAEGIDVCVVLAGGYADDLRDTVDINAATATAVATRTRVFAG